MADPLLLHSRGARNLHHSPLVSPVSEVGRLAPGLLRGGALSQSERLLDGLKCLLAEVEQESDITTESDPNGDALFSALQDLVSKRPKNLLQELKSLVRRFSRRQVVPDTVTPKKGFSKGSNASLSDSSKGTGKNKGNPDNTRSSALQTKGKGKGTSAAPTQGTVSTPHESEASSWVMVARNGRAKKTVEQTKPEVGKHRSGDWTGPVVTTAEELDKLGPEKQTVVALPSSSSEAELVWALMAARDKVDCTFVFNYQTQKDFVSATEQALGISPQLMTVPLHFSNGLRFVQRFVLHRGKDAPQPKVTGIKVAAPTAAKANSVVLRAKTRKVLAQEWDKVQSNAGLHFRSWALQSEGLKSSDFRDTWGWEKLGQEDIQGLVRVNQTKADRLLQISGVCHGGVRWFLEPLRWEAPLTQTSPPAVEWIEHEHLSAAAKTACEIAQRHGLGVILGRRQIGVRKKRCVVQDASAPQPRTRIWKFLGVPHDMCGDDVISLATEAGFKDVKVLDYFRWRKGKGWTVKATRQDQTSHLEIVAGETTIMASSDFGRVDRRPHQALPSERKVSLGVAAKIVPAKQSRFPLSVKATGFGGSQKPDERSSPPPKKAKVVKAPPGLELIRNAGQGNCLFHAISDACKTIGQSRGHGVLRAMTVTHLRKYKEAYEATWDMCTPTAEGNPMDAADFEKYLDLLAADGRSLGWCS